MRDGGAYSSSRDTRSIASGEERAGNTFSGKDSYLGVGFVICQANCSVRH